MVSTKFNDSYKCFSISTEYTSPSFWILTIVTYATQEGLKLMRADSLFVASLSFLEIDDMPNSIEVLRVHHSVNR